MYNYIHYSGNVSGKCLSPHNATHASVIIRYAVSVCSEGPNGLQTVCKSLVGAVLRGFSHQCDIVVIEHGGTCIARTRIARYDRLWTHCHVYISSHSSLNSNAAAAVVFSKVNAPPATAVDDSSADAIG